MGTLQQEPHTFDAKTPLCLPWPRWCLSRLRSRKRMAIEIAGANQCKIQMIGLREKLQENPMIFTGKSGWFPVKIFPSTNPLRKLSEKMWENHIQS